MDLINYVGIIFLTVSSAYMYRWRGMNENEVPSIFQSRFVRRLLCCVIIGIGAWWYGVSGVLSDAWIIAAVAVLSYFGIIVGHGSYFTRFWREEKHNFDNERFAFITKLFANPLDHKARIIGMACTGLATTIPVACLGIYLGSWVMIAFAPIGILKALVYNIKVIDEIDGMNERNWGAILGGSMSLIWLALSLAGFI